MIQYRGVDKPTEEDYKLGMAIINKLYKKESSVDFGK